MANKPRSPMPIAERAKQFLPFAAVRGLEDALARKEKIPVARIDMTEERAAKLSETMHQIVKGSTVTITYFYDEEYIRMTGRVVRADDVYQQLQIAETTINFDDILEIEMILDE